MLKIISLLVASCSCLRAVSAVDEWSQFRGPNGTGVSEPKACPRSLDQTRTSSGKLNFRGHSSPVLTRDRIFVTAHDKDKLFVIALDRQTGKIFWQREVPRSQSGRLQNVNGPASPSPVTDGTNVYVFFQDFGMLSYDAAGKERWKLPLGPFNMFYGFGASPILVDDKVILPVDQTILRRI
jgi:outer membrane protein assembly factor BamB